MSKVEVTKKELTEEASKFALAAKKLKKVCAHRARQIKFLKHQNKDLRATDFWRAQKMERQAFQIWKLKLLLSEAGYDPQNLPQPKGLRIVAAPPDPSLADGVNTPTPKSRSTSPKPPSPFKYSDPVPKRKRAEFDEDEEFNPHSKRRALSLKVFLESNIYACEETYTQYLVDHQLGCGVPDVEDDMDLDEDEDYDEELEEGAENAGEEKPENPASLFKEYLVKNNLPASRQLDDAKDMAIQKAKAQAQTQHTSKEDQKYFEDLDLALARSLEDFNQKKEKDKGGQGGDEDGEAITEDESEEGCAYTGEEEALVESEDEEEKEETPTEHEDEEEDASDEEEKEVPAKSDEDEDASDEEEEEGAPDEHEDEEKQTSNEEEEEEEEAPAESDGEEEDASEDEEDANEEEEEEEASIHEPSELMDEDGAEGEVLVSKPSQTSDSSGEEEEEEAPVPEPFEYYSNNDEEAKVGSPPPKRRLSEFQLAIERSLHPANPTEERVEIDAPGSTPVASMDQYWGYEEAKASKPSKHNLEGEKDAPAASQSSEEDSLDLQYALELSLQQPFSSDKEEEEENPPISQSAECKTILPPSLVGSKREKEEPAPKSAGYFDDGGKEVEIPKGKYSELELSVAMTLESLRRGGWGKEVERPTFRVGERLSEDYDGEEAPVPEPFEYYSDNEESANVRDPDF